ncbi:MAG: sulfatase [Pseudomonadaceae bacterium]|nr:sulfatase [Pseudomonadaceae bacterium]
MKGKHRLIAAIILLSAVMTGMASYTLAGEPTQPPNIIIFLTDDQGYADAGVYGSNDLDTPNIDQLAQEGIRFTSFYAQPLCGPSRAALLTGRYPVRINEPGNTKSPNTTLAASEVTVAEVLQQAGYRTALIGKWHLAGDGAPWDYAPPPLPPGKPGGKGPFDKSLMPNAQGFDYFFGTPMHNGYTQKVDPDRFIVDLMRNQSVIETQTDVDQLTTRYTQEALEFIRSNTAAPFFLLLSHNMPHVSLGVSSRFAGKSRRGLYGDVIMELDWSLGEVLAELQRLDIDQRTLVIFLSDNGPPLGQLTDRNGASAEPLRGGKYSNWEGGVRVPAIMRWPNNIPAKQEDNDIASIMDLLPTIIAASDAELPSDLNIDGFNLEPRLRGHSTSNSRAHFYYSLTTLQAVRKGRWKLVLPRKKDAPELLWLARYTEDVADYQLYDLEADISETQNVANLHPEVVTDLLMEIERGAPHQ